MWTPRDYTLLQLNESDEDEKILRQIDAVEQDIPEKQIFHYRHFHFRVLHAAEKEHCIGICTPPRGVSHGCAC